MVVLELRDKILTPENFTEKDGVRLAQSLYKQPASVDMVIEEFLSEDLRLRQRISWVLMAFPELDQSCLTPQIDRLLSVLFKTKENSLKRNILRLLQIQSIPEKHHGPLIDFCFNILEDKKEAVAIQVFAMTVAGKLAKPYPELLHELALLLEANYEYGTAGYKSRARKIIKMIK